MGSCRAVSAHLIALHKKRNWIDVRRHCCSLTSVLHLKKEKGTQFRISRGMRNCTAYLREELDSNGLRRVFCIRKVKIKSKRSQLSELRMLPELLLTSQLFTMTVPTYVHSLTSNLIRNSVQVGNRNSNTIEFSSSWKSEQQHNEKSEFCQGQKKTLYVNVKTSPAFLFV